MVRDLAIFGAGGYGREMASLLKRINKQQQCWNFIGFFDDDVVNKPIGYRNEYGEILGNLEMLNTYPKPLSVILAIGKPKILKAVYEAITNPLIDFPNIVAPEAHILDIDNFSMGKGNILGSFSSMSCNVHIGDFNIFNNRVSLGHDVLVGNYNSFMTASRISGGTKIGTLNYFGVSAVVLPNINIGAGTTIGANSVLMKNAKDNAVYIGNPAKKFDFE